MMTLLLSAALVAVAAAEPNPAEHHHHKHRRNHRVDPAVASATSSSSAKKKKNNACECGEDEAWLAGIMRRAYWKGFVGSAERSKQQWTPEVEANELSKLAKGQLADLTFEIERKALVEEELRRSVRAYKQLKTVDEAEKVSEAFELKDKFVVVYDNRVVVHADFLNKTKNPGHAKLVRSVAQEAAGLGNAVYAAEVSTSGLSCSSSFPSLVVNKQFGYAQCGVLIPNTYFGGGNLSTWRAFVDNQTTLSEAKPWASRSNHRAFWRGTMTAPANARCVDDFGNFARLSAIAAAIEAPDLVDTGCFLQHHGNLGRSCAARLGDNPCRGNPHPPPHDQLMAGLARDPSPAIRDFVPLANFTNQKILLNLPGGKTGSYSRNLNTLWLSGALVFLWDAPYVEWYFPALSHGTTHLAVSRRTLAGTVSAVLDENDSSVDVAALLRNARRVHDTFLCPECLARHVHLVFAAIRHHFAMDQLLDDPASACAFFRRHLRSHCADLREILDEPLGTKRVLVRHLRPDDDDDPICGACPPPQVDNNNEAS